MNPKILVADDDQEVLELLKFTLSSEQYTVITAEDGERALALALGEVPDLIVLDVQMPKLSGFEVCEKIRENPLTSLIPIIILTSLSKTKDRITGIKLGADEYMTKPFEPVELVVRVESLLKRIKETISANPLTKLPGNISIETEIKKKMEGGKPFAVSFVDIDCFKSFNDKYGFGNGDEIIKLVSLILRNAISEAGALESFLGHLGSDDFVMIAPNEKAELICQKAIKSFSEIIPEKYDEDARKRGYLWGMDRQGKQVKYPMITLSIGVAKIRPGMYNHYSQIIEQAKFLLKKAKTTSGSSCEIG